MTRHTMRSRWPAFGVSMRWDFLGARCENGFDKKGRRMHVERVYGCQRGEHRLPDSRGLGLAGRPCEQTACPFTASVADLDLGQKRIAILQRTGKGSDMLIR